MADLADKSPPQLHAVGYIRVSTDKQGEHGLGMSAQRDAIERACIARSWHLDSVQSDVLSGKSLTRLPGLAAALACVRGYPRDTAALVLAKSDRFRSALGALQLKESAESEGWALVCLDIGADTTSLSGSLVFGILATINEHERKAIGERTRVALAALQRRGVRLGRPSTLTAGIRAGIVAMRRDGMSYRAIAARLTAESVPVAGTGAQWWPSTVRSVERSTNARLDCAQLESVPMA